ncbi:MAG: glutamine-hydrolyzing GMP synthase [Thermodesulfobacteriota bacterium]|nr:glutamine-hydrolyzing GMP synthase [Thermodesulfobacteriota bacterium]
MTESIEQILILDFGSQYTQLIARRIRECQVYCEIYPFNIPLKEIIKLGPKGIILSGSPSSVYDVKAPFISKEIFHLNIPILGICYGMQLIAHLFGGMVEKSKKREYGKAFITLEDCTTIFKGFKEKKKIQVWMSHGDKIGKLPPEFYTIAKSQNSPFAVIKARKLPLYGVQFHPEVVHTPRGKEILSNFLFEICKCRQDWTIKGFIQNKVQEIRDEVGDKKVVCAVSGGVDSTVVAVLINRAIGENLTCIFVNNGLLRKEEKEEVVRIFKENFKINLKYVDAEKRFLKKLKGIVEPEEKRKIIGREFIKVFEEEAKKNREIEYLAQGTLYPDLIESISHKGPSATIKSHHNVGGLPETMNLNLIEPLKELFKDEVRKLGLELGIPSHIVYRQPFPGPGLAIRILGEVTGEKLEILREADAIVTYEIGRKKYVREIWQYFAILLPIKTVGIMGDERTYENLLAIRAVSSKDGMTADWYKLPYKTLEEISGRIINEIKGINRVVFDISSKPPSTIEWE